MKIINIRRGTGSRRAYIYAELMDSEGKTECMATLEYILLTRFDVKDTISNYNEALQLLIVLKLGND